MTNEQLMQDELGLNLYDFHARQYDPQIGRFWGIDPADQFPNGYTGMGSDPANSIDPSGINTENVNAYFNYGKPVFSVAIPTCLAGEAHVNAYDPGPVATPVAGQSAKGDKTLGVEMTQFDKIGPKAEEMAASFAPNDTKADEAALSTDGVAAADKNSGGGGANAAIANTNSDATGGNIGSPPDRIYQGGGDSDDKENKNNPNNPLSGKGSENFHNEKIKIDKQNTIRDLDKAANKLANRNSTIEKNIQKQQTIIKIYRNYSSEGGDSRHGIQVARALIMHEAQEQIDNYQREYNQNQNMIDEYQQQIIDLR